MSEHMRAMKDVAALPFFDATPQHKAIITRMSPLHFMPTLR